MHRFPVFSRAVHLDGDADQNALAAPAFTRSGLCTEVHRQIHGVESLPVSGRRRTNAKPTLSLARGQFGSVLFRFQTATCPLVLLFFHLADSSLPGRTGETAAGPGNRGKPRRSSRIDNPAGGGENERTNRNASVRRVPKWRNWQTR